MGGRRGRENWDGDSDGDGDGDDNGDDDGAEEEDDKPEQAIAL